MISYSVFFKSFFSILLVVSLPFPGIGKTQQQYQEDTLPSESFTDLESVKFLVGLSQLIIQDKARLNNLKKDSSSLEPVFNETAIRFSRVNDQLGSLKNTVGSTQNTATVEQEWEKLEDGLEYLLSRRRNVHQQIKILKRKIEKEQESFALAMKGKATLVMEISEQYTLQEDTDSIVLDSTGVSDTTLYEKDINFNQVNTEYNWRIVDAERELEILQAEFEVAKKTWFLVEQLLKINQDDLSILQSMTENAYQQLGEWKRTITALEGKLIALQKKASDEPLQYAIKERIDQGKDFITSVESALSQDSILLSSLEARIEKLEVLKKPLSASLAEATRNITNQNRWLDYLRSPLAPHRLYSFLVNSGPRIVLIIVSLFLLWAGGRWLTGRILGGLKLSRYKSKTDREERVETLSRAIRSGLTVAVLFIGFLAILSEFGINVSVLLGGAAVFSLALAFGAQSLVKDFFTGFMILSENQYRVGNVIKINQISGSVEDISLRTTVLRDLEGIAHFIPHGEITTVSNLTHRWSRVALDIGVAYKENVDHVMEVVMGVALQMREDPQFHKLISDEPEMLGVDALADSAVVIKILIKTKPLKQWLVKREFLRRLKNRFDELGIEIPFPHRTIYHRDLTISDVANQKVKRTDHFNDR